SLAVDVDAGTRYRIASLAIDTATPADSALFAAALGIGVGDWAATAALDQALGVAVRRAAEAGHPSAQLALTQFDWDRAGARVRLGGSLGPTVVVSEVRFEGM